MATSAPRIQPAARCPMTFLLLAVVLLISTHSAFAVPFYWVSRHEEPQNNCTAHPEIGYKGHGAPSVNSNITFMVMGSSNDTVSTSVCPGSNYTIQVALPTTGHSLFTASQGSFATPAANDTCTNRYYNPGRSPAPSWQDTLALPCNATGTVVLRVTTAAGTSAPYYTNSLGLTVDPKCAAPACPKPKPCLWRCVKFLVRKNKP